MLTPKNVSFDQLKIYACHLIIFIVIASILFSKSAGQDVFRTAGYLLILIPFLKVPYSQNIKYYALAGFMFSNAIVLGNFLSPYVDNWNRGLTGIYYWLMILPAYLLAYYSRASTKSLYLILFLSVCVAMIPATSDLITGLRRYKGFHGQPIPWGNLSLLTGLLCLTFAIPYKDKHYIKNHLVPLIAIMIGLFCSFFSGTRGGWILFITILPFLLYEVLKHQSPKLKVFSVVSICLLVFSVISIKDLGIQKRFEIAVDEITAYSNGEEWARHTSVGTRFELWKSSYKAIKEYPITGIGAFGLKKWIREDPNYFGETRHGHPHNFYVALLLYGIPALLAFIALIYFFCKETMFDIPDTAEAHLIRRLSIILLLAYMEFSLTETAWGIRLFSSYFIFVSVYLMYLQHQERNKLTEGERS